MVAVVVLCVFFVLLGEVCSQAVPGCLCFEELAEARGFVSPTVFRNARDGSGRMFIGEHHGLVHIFYEDGEMLPTPFLNLTDLVYIGGSEEGFLAMEFHPHFRENRKLYVYYTLREGGTGTRYSRVTELFVMEDNPNRVDHSSERELMRIAQTASNHNGGDMYFGPKDEYLYIFTGDGGGGGDPPNNAQNMDRWLGKVLRIDIDTQDDGLAYGIPPDNPFVDTDGALPEIFALGMRNPWRVSLDMGPEGDETFEPVFYIGDVGQNWMEEVDLLYPADREGNLGDAGGNFGWAAWEGCDCYKTNMCGNILEPVVLPIYNYTHAETSGSGGSITGGPVYRGCHNPALQGKYIFGDWSSGEVWYLAKDPDVEDVPANYCTLTPWKKTLLEVCGGSTCANRGWTGSNRFNYINSFGESESGEVYIVTTLTTSPTASNGAVYKIIDTASYDPAGCQK